MGINTEIHNCTVFREWEAKVGCLHHLLPLKVQVFVWKRSCKVCKSQRLCMTERKQHFPDTAGLVSLWIYIDEDSKLQPDRSPTQRRGTGHRVPLPTKKLLYLIASGYQNQFYLTAWHCVYQPYSGVGNMVMNSWPTQNRLHVLFCGEPFFILREKRYELRKVASRYLGELGEGKEYDQIRLCL